MISSRHFHQDRGGARSGATADARQWLRVVDPEGGQSGDLVALRLGDATEWLSNGRSINYGGKISFTTGDVLYSNRSNPMLTIIEDQVGHHDFLYTPCSIEMYRREYGVTGHHANCLDNLSQALGIEAYRVPTAFNFFMYTTVQPDGRIKFSPPASKKGDAIVFRAEMDLSIWLSACPASNCNGGTTGSLAYELVES